MEPGARSIVLWLGASPSTTLRGALSERGLQLKRVNEKALTRSYPRARGLIVAFEGNVGEFVGRIRRNWKDALNHGLTVGTVCDQRANLLDFGRVQGALPKIPVHRLIPISQDWTRIAQLFDRHDPGPGAEKPLRLLAIPKVLSEEEKLLLKRGFADCTLLRLKLLKGGRSGAKLLLAHPVEQKKSAHRRRTMPCVIKLDDRDRIAGEVANFSQFMEGCVPFNSRPNVDRLRGAEGSSAAMLVQDFVHRAIPLLDALKIGSPALFIASLFECALKGCRSGVTPMHGGLVAELYRLRVLNWSKDLDDAATFAQAHLGAKRSPKALERRLGALGTSDFLRCTVHGDLNPGNIFVASASSDTILIDFYKTELGPAISDPAALEVSIAFPAGDKAFSPAEERKIAALYAPPLSHSASGDLSAKDWWRRETIRAIRVHALAMEPRAKSPTKPTPYSIAVACYLLRFASYADNLPRRRRALAYTLAEKLLG